MGLTVYKESTAIVDENLRAFIDPLPTALLPRGSGLVKQDTIARNLRRGAHPGNVEVLRRPVRGVYPT